NFVILIWERGWYLTYHYWPTSYNTHVFEGNLYFVPAKNARERLAHEMAAVTFKEYSLQDGNTLEATQIMLESRVVTAFPLNDQEILCRHLHKVAADWIGDYTRELAKVGQRPAHSYRRSSPSSNRSRRRGACPPSGSGSQSGWRVRWTRCRRSTTRSSPAPRRRSRTARSSPSTTCPRTPSGCCSSCTPS